MFLLEFDMYFISTILTYLYFYVDLHNQIFVIKLEIVDIFIYLYI